MQSTRKFCLVLFPISTSFKIECLEQKVSSLSEEVMELLKMHVYIAD